MAQPTEHLGNLGYVGLGKQTAVGTPIVPTDYAPMYAEDLSTKTNLVSDQPVVGLAFQTYNILQGQRGHTGKLSVMAEPNTAAKWFDMLMTKGNVSGGGPYTWPYTCSSTTTYYTVDVSTGNQVVRYYDVLASQISWNIQAGNEITFDVDVSALHSWAGRALASQPTGTNPWTLVFDTTYDPRPTDGLVVGDLLQVQKAAGGTINIAIATINANGTTITTTTADPTTAATGDFVIIRAATPSFTLLTPFLWSRTEFRFGTTAAGALSATHTPLEVGSVWTIQNKFENAEGAKRSGSFDPGGLPRIGYDALLHMKRAWDTPSDLANFLAITKVACVVRMFSGASYELRVTFNNLKVATTPKPKGNNNAVLYTESDLIPQYDTSDAQAVAVTVINNLSTF